MTTSGKNMEQGGLSPNRLKRLALLGTASAMILVAGCRQDMHNQPKFIPQRGTTFYADHRSERPQVVGTVARGQLKEDTYFYTGTVEGANGYREERDALPFPVTMTVLERGQERFNIYCTPCHSRVGNGLGAIVARGYKVAANLNDDVHRAQPVSHYFYVMTRGYGAMPDYSAQIAPVDRWAIAAYIRALQLSQHASEKDVPAGVTVQQLKSIAEAKGLPVNFADPWELPTTAVEALPADKSQGTPAMVPAYPAAPKIVVPHTALPASGAHTNSITAKPAGVQPGSGN